jgi:1,4-dihydroxy-2-naphthoate octaprenyltransferase
MIALWHLSRPKLLPFVLLLPLCGYGLAHWDRALLARGVDALVLTLVAWTLLHAGTLWLNAAVDRDEGPVLYGTSVAPPPYAAAAGYVALFACVGIGALARPAIGAGALVCALLAVAYSHPASLWKGHAVLGPLVNLVGYGLVSPLVGFLAVDVPPTWRLLTVWVAGGIGVMGAYFAAQAFQHDEDAARDYRTLVVTHGATACVRAARWCMLVGMVIGTTMAVVGWVPRVCLVAVPLAIWVDAHFRAWLAVPGGGDVSHARALVQRLLVSALLAIALCFADYFWADAHGLPVAGLGTAAGHPPDRPVLAPLAMRRWEALNKGVLVRP